MREIRACDCLAALLLYPGPEYREAVAECRDLLAPLSGGAAAALARFEAEVSRLPLQRLQELYVESFDFDPACALELGWHLHRERYERGEFLASLRTDLERAGVNERSELPDHLGFVLQLIVRSDPASAERLRDAAAPAVAAVQEGLQRHEGPYLHLVQAIARLLEDLPLVQFSR